MKLQPVYFLFLTAIAVSCKKNSDAPNPSQQKKWMVTTVAGDGIAHFNDGASSTAEFHAPQDVTVSADGSIYVADAINHRIRKIANNIVSSFAGSGIEDTTGGVGTAAAFALPVQITLDNAGNIYTLDIDDFRVRKISASANVTVVAGSGERGFADGSAASAKFGECTGITTDNAGNIFISDNENKRIRKISAEGLVTTIAGNGESAYLDGQGTNAEFTSPTGIVADKNGNLFVADFNRIRKITPGGTVSTYAGAETLGYKDGPANTAQFTLINDIVMDKTGNIFVTDDNKIREISADGNVSTIAGSVAGYKDGDGASAKFNNPVGLGIDSNGNIYVADDNNNRIRKISFE